MGIYSRLYTYRETPSLSPVENFLTEALADIFNRLPRPLQIEFLVRMLPTSCSERLQNKCKDGKKIEAITQVSIVAGESVKRPDMILYLDAKPLILFEVKVGAAVQEHERKDSGGIERPVEADISEIVVQSQLKTYSEWIGSQRSGDWSGAVVFLTHRTLTPEGFENEGREGNSVIGVTRTWKDIGDWIANNLDLNQSETTHCALASDFNGFLEEEGLMTDFITSRDLAATALFMPAYEPLTHTFRTVISAVASKYPKSKGGNVHLEFWPGANVYWAWYYLNSKLNPSDNKFYIAIGICFPEGSHESELLVGLPKHEPFFFVYIADDWEKVMASKLLSKVPKGWQGVYDDFDLIVTRPVSKFDPDPDVRALSLIDWAQEEVGRAMACIPKFEAAPIQKIQEAAED
jgi:hypothetical protein